MLYFVTIMSLYAVLSRCHSLYSFYLFLYGTKRVHIVEFDCYVTTPLKRWQMQ